MQSANNICHGHLSVLFRPPPPSLRILLATTSSLCHGLAVLYHMYVLHHTASPPFRSCASGSALKRPGLARQARRGMRCSHAGPGRTGAMQRQSLRHGRRGRGLKDRERSCVNATAAHRLLHARALSDLDPHEVHSKTNLILGKIPESYTV
jgi:hypothetical protein